MEKERRYKRAPLSADVRLFIDEGAHTSILRGMIVEISLSGIGIYLTQPLKVGSKVQFELYYLVASDEIKTETVRGTTIYSRYIHDIYFLGIEFDQELNPLHQLYLCKRIQESLESF
jgi:c-di-GMP-binding flagellar brake protein YcgR